MTKSPDRKISNMEGNAALPRKNGELVFQAPWEGRAFGIAVALNADGFYEWRDFREQLVGEIASTEKSGSPSSYYEQWLASLEKVVIAKGFISQQELDTRTAEYASNQRHDDDD